MEVEVAVGVGSLMVFSSEFSDETWGGFFLGVQGGEMFFFVRRL